MPSLGDRAGPGKDSGGELARVSPRTGWVGAGARGHTDGLLLPPYRAVGQMMSTLFYPLVTFVLLLISIVYWAMTALYPLPTWPSLLGQGQRRGSGKGRYLPTQCLSAIGRRYPFLWADTGLPLDEVERLSPG